MLVFGVISSIINDGDYLSLLIFFKFIFTLFLSTAIVLWGIRLYKDRFFQKILSIIVVSGLIIAATNVLEYFLPPFRLLLLKYISVTGNTDYELSFRTHGFASSGGASLSVGTLVVCLLSFWKYKISETRFDKTFYYLSFILIYVSILVIGRTGLFLGFPIVMFLLFFEGISILSFFKKAVIISLLVLGISSVLSILSDDDVNIFFKYGLEPIYNYMEYGTFESKSTTAVSKMYYLPEAVHFLFGAGFWRYPTHNYPLPDVGYMKMLMSTGIFGVLIFYSYQITIYKEVYKFYSAKYKLKFLFLFLFLIPFLGELKESFFTQNYTFKILSILIVYSWIVKKMRFNTSDRLSV